MAADPKCPECGATAILDFSGKMYCQGKNISDEEVHQVELDLKEAVSLGRDVTDIDKAYRAITAQKTCGAILFQDTDQTWKRVVPGPGV